jgi:hypothetical protein
LRWLFIIARNDTPSAPLLPSKDTFAELLKKTWGQHAIVVFVTTAWDRAKVKSRPREAIQLIEAEPMPAAVQTQTLTDCGWNFDGSRSLFRRLMSNGRDNSVNVATHRSSGSNDDRARSILRAF